MEITILRDNWNTGGARPEVRVLENRANQTFRHCRIGIVTLKERPKPRLGNMDGYVWSGPNVALMNYYQAKNYALHEK